jgi:hypothetical protein
MADIKFSFKPNYKSSTTGATIFGEDATKTYELVFDDVAEELIVRSTLKSDGTTEADELVLTAAV